MLCCVVLCCVVLSLEYTYSRYIHQFPMVMRSDLVPVKCTGKITKIDTKQHDTIIMMSENINQRGIWNP
jgi:hypothetical protein